MLENKPRRPPESRFANSLRVRFAVLWLRFKVLHLGFEGLGLASRFRVEASKPSHKTSKPGPETTNLAQNPSYEVSKVRSGFPL